MWDEEYAPENDGHKKMPWHSLVTLILVVALMWAVIIKGLILLDRHFDFTGWVLSSIGGLR